MAYTNELSAIWAAVTPLILIPIDRAKRAMERLE
jgi:hypothetical protein